MQEEDQDVTFPVSPLEGVLQYPDHVVLGQFIRIVIDDLFPPASDFFQNNGFVERLGPRATFERALAAQVINRHAGRDMHQVDLGLELRRAAETLEGGAFVLENLEVNFLKEIGDDFYGGRAINA